MDEALLKTLEAERHELPERRLVQQQQWQRLMEEGMSRERLMEEGMSRERLMEEGMSRERLARLLPQSQPIVNRHQRRAAAKGTR